MASPVSKEYPETTVAQRSVCWTLHKAGKSYSEISRLEGLPRPTVASVIQEEGAEIDFHSVPRAGGRRRRSARTSKNVGVCTPVPRDKVKKTPVHKTIRLQWCLERGNTNWDLMVWSGEFTLEIERDRDESMTFWYCFMGREKGPVVAIEQPGRRMTQELYTDLVLRPHLIPFYERMRARYGQGVQVSEKGVIYYTANPRASKGEREVKCLPWPLHSTDLTPMGDVRERLKWRVKKHLRRHGLGSEEDMRLAVQEAWQRFEPEFLQELVDSMPKRMVACIAGRGGDVIYRPYA